MTEDTIPAHGGTLVDLVLPLQEAGAAADEAANHPKLKITQRDVADLEMLSNGAMSPLTGFMDEKDYRSVIDDMRLASGVPWTIPVTLNVSEDDVKRIGRSGSVLLQSGNSALAILDVTGVFERDLAAETQSVYGTTDEAHPGVKAAVDSGRFAIAGTVRALQLPKHSTFEEYRLTPAETRKAFRERGWKRVVGFQTRNPVHRAHEYIQKCALEIVDGLLLHPLVGATKSDDVPADVRMRCYEVLFEEYYPADRAMLSVFPANMRYAGPKEAIFHAICRKNYGCTHFIVGRDHAGVGDYYGTYEAQEMFDRFEPDELGITPLRFEHTFWCNRCEGMASAKTCPHGEDDRISLSGTKVRDMLRAGEMPPIEFSRPEVAKILIDAMSGASE
ncbi:MAG: sulfate adenylyltransferase [Actinobacteria bacterium]|nr:sulfate adenylyltransferase [Actinomycetota bacterium]